MVDKEGELRIKTTAGLEQAEHQTNNAIQAEEDGEGGVQMSKSNSGKCMRKHFYLPTTRGRNMRYDIKESG